MNGADAHRSALRARVDRVGITLLPGVYDALSARLAGAAGFPVLYVSGAGIANARRAVPDLGLLTATELCSCVEEITSAVSVPVIVDIDAGYGPPMALYRLACDLFDLGVAGVQIEDQVEARRCGHLDGVEVVEPEVMVERIATILVAKEDRGASDAIIVARTDARRERGLEEAIARGCTYMRAGGDVVFVEALESAHEVRLIADRISAPTLINLVEGGRTPPMSLAMLERLGVRFALYANAALRSAMFALERTYSVLRNVGSSEPLLAEMVSWNRRQEIVGLSSYVELSQRIARRIDEGATDAAH